MRAVIFIETKNGLFFKCDSFWSQSERPDHAKVYSNDSLSELKGWLQSVLPYNVYKDRIDFVKDKYDGAKLGYFTPTEDLYRDSYCLKAGTEVKDLGKPIYLWIIKMNDVSDWVIKKETPADPKDPKSKDSIDFDSKSLGEFIDYKQSHRDEVIGDILKDSE